MRIGYQGEVGSNAEAAAQQMADELGLENVEFVPLVRSDAVVTSLRAENIDYGVVATKNSIAGGVAETFAAIRDEDLELVDTCILEVHHCLFKRKEVAVEDLRSVASHEQALAQTRHKRARLYPQLEELPIEDTAIGAQWLASGHLSAQTAVICRDSAGIANGLELIEANLEDVSPSLTEFRMYKMPTLDYTNSSEPSLEDRLVYLLINQDGMGALSKALLVLLVFAALFFVGRQAMDAWELAGVLASGVSAIFLFLTSDSIRNLVKFRPIKGYWKYYSVADEDRKSSLDLLYETPRIVEIDEIDGELVMRGWICDKAAIPFFESAKTIVSSPGKARGSLVYWYQPPAEAGRGVRLGGFADLNWQRKHLAAKVNSMSGRYYGWATGETGTIRFLRLTDHEYEVHRRCEFLGSSAPYTQDVIDK